MAARTLGGLALGRLAAAGMLAGLPTARRPPIARAQARSPLRIGASLSLSGIWAIDGRNVGLAYTYWAEEINGAGGLLGRPVELVILDDAGTAERCAENYRRLIGVEQCDLLLGPYGSVPAAGALPVIEEAEFPCAVPISASPSLWATPRRWCVQVTPNADRYMDGPLTAAAAAGARTVALIHLDSGFTNDIATGVRRKASELGLDLIADVSYPDEEADFEALVAALAGRGVDVLIGGGYLLSAVGLTRAVRRLGIAVSMMCWMEGPHRWPWPQAMGAEGDYVTTTGLWLPSLSAAGNDRFVQGFRARFGGEYAMDMLSGALTVQTAAGYAAALVTQRAVEAADTVAHEAVRDALFGLETETPYGPFGVDGRGAQVAKRVVASQWIGGKQRVFWPPEHAEADLVYPAPPPGERL